MMTIAHNWQSVNCDLWPGFFFCAVIYASFRCGNAPGPVRGVHLPLGTGAGADFAPPTELTEGQWLAASLAFVQPEAKPLKTAKT
jgi:hypothetical protein